MCLATNGVETRTFGASLGDDDDDDDDDNNNNNIY